MKIREYRPEDRPACAAIFAEIEAWFGIPEAVSDYLEGLESRPAWIAVRDDNVAGFLALEPHTSDAAEVWVAAVAPDLHRRGVGRALVLRAEEHCRSSGIRYLQVKTLDESRTSPEYAVTRKAWLGLGFRPLQTFPELWDASNPALQLVKVVPRHTARSLIESLDLEPHPEGGYFRETWRSERLLDLYDYDGVRNAGTCIHFLLPTGEASAWHRVASDEIWIWQKGDPLELMIREERDGTSRGITLGVERFQAVVPGGEWQAARPLAGEHGYTLVSCVVVPGFDFADFEM